MTVSLRVGVIIGIQPSPDGGIRPLTPGPMARYPSLTEFGASSKQKFCKKYPYLFRFFIDYYSFNDLQFTNKRSQLIPGSHFIVKDRFLDVESAINTSQF
jgi:hypothetical protein